jgi:L-rhamnose mutarotase
VSKETIRYIYRLKPGAGATYDLAHRAVPQELLDLIAEAGISNYTIWRHEEIVVCEFDTAIGYDASTALLAASDIQKQWTKSLLHLFDKIDDGGEPLWLREVFRWDGV